jgi:hypothetical protein
VTEQGETATSHFMKLQNLILQRLVKERGLQWH